MRTTVTLDEDVVAIIERERRLSGETTRQAINRLIRTSSRRAGPGPELPKLPGRLEIDISNVSGRCQPFLGRLRLRTSSSVCSRSGSTARSLGRSAARLDRITASSDATITRTAPRSVSTASATSSV